MKGSDWKIFVEIKQRALETMCAQALADFQNVIADNTETYHARYLQLYRLVRERDKEVARIFDEHSRSKANFQLTQMRHAGIVDEELLAQLSPECRQATDPKWLG